MYSYAKNEYRRRLKAAVCLFIIMMLMMCLFAACGKQEESAIGEENYNASLALISYEMIDDQFDGIIYREVISYSSLIARSEVPVLTVFYNRLSDLNRHFIPVLEEMAVTYDERLLIVMVDIEAEQSMADQFEVDTVPQFSIVQDATLKRSLIGFDDAAPSRLRELIEQYISE